MYVQKNLKKISKSQNGYSKVKIDRVSQKKISKSHFYVPKKSQKVIFMSRKISKSQKVPQGDSSGGSQKNLKNSFFLSQKISKSHFFVQENPKKSLLCPKKSQKVTFMSKKSQKATFMSKGGLQMRYLFNAACKLQMRYLFKAACRVGCRCGTFATQHAKGGSQTR